MMSPKHWLLLLPALLAAAGCKGESQGQAGDSGNSNGDSNGACQEPKPSAGLMCTEMVHYCPEVICDRGRWRCVAGCDYDFPPCWMCPDALCAGNYCAEVCDRTAVEPCLELTQEIPQVCALHPDRENPFGTACWESYVICSASCPGGACFDVGRCLMPCITDAECETGEICGLNTEYPWMRAVCWPADLCTGNAHCVHFCSPGDDSNCASGEMCGASPRFAGFPVNFSYACWPPELMEPLPDGDTSGGDPPAPPGDTKSGDATPPGDSRTGDARPPSGD